MRYKEKEREKERESKKRRERVKIKTMKIVCNRLRFVKHSDVKMNEELVFDFWFSLQYFHQGGLNIFANLTNGSVWV